MDFEPTAEGNANGVSRPGMMIATIVAVGVSVGARVAVNRGAGVSVAGTLEAIAVVFEERGLHPAVTIKIKTKIADTFRIPACTSLGLIPAAYRS